MRRPTLLWDHSETAPAQADIDMPDINYVLDENPLHERTIHLFPKNPRYRLSGNYSQPLPGDIARCGVVKKGVKGITPPGSANCAACIRLKRLSE